VYLDVSPRAFGIAEIRLLCQHRVESGEEVRTGDQGAPVDVIAKTCGVGEVRISHQCQCSAGSEGVRIGDRGAHANVTLNALEVAKFQSLDRVGNGERGRESDQGVQKTWYGHKILRRTESIIVGTRTN